MSLEEKVGQLFFIGIPSPVLDEGTQILVSEIMPGGICLFARNIKSPDQTRALLEGLNDALPVKPFLSVDQEGGLVDRLRRIMSPAPAAAKFKNVSDVREFGEITAESLRILGFNMDFAPVVDVITAEREDAGNGMYSRAFGNSAEAVGEYAGAFFDSLQKGGIFGCLKHFPGLGAARSDSHEDLPQIDVSGDELRSMDLQPYNEMRNRGVEMVMIAHATYPGSDLQQTDQNGRLLPSSMSANFVSKLLRDEMGFNGIAITDDLEMGAIVKNYGIGEACKMALDAGNDMLAICAKKDAIREGFSAVSEAVAAGEIDEDRIDESVARISDLKLRLQPASSFDPDRLTELTQQLKQLNARVS